MAKIIMNENATSPDTPSTGKRVLYSKNGGFYEKDDQGVETKLGSIEELNQLNDVEITNVEEGDFLIYDDTDSKWKNQKTTGTIFGCSFNETHDDTFDSNSSSNFETYTSMVVTQCEANKKYRIGTFTVWAMSTTSQDFEADITAQQEGGSEQVVGSLRQEAKDAGTDQKISSSGFFYYTPTVSGDITLRLKYRPESGGGTAYMWYGGLEWWRVEL